MSKPNLNFVQRLERLFLLLLTFGSAVLGNQAFAQSNLLFAANYLSNSVGLYTLTGAAVSSSLISTLSRPVGIAVSGNRVFVSNYASNTVGAYTTAGDIVDESFISIPYPIGLAAEGANLFVVSNPSGGNASILHYTTSGSFVGTVASGLADPYAIAVSGTDLYVADQYLHTISKYSVSGAGGGAIVTGPVSGYSLAVAGTNLFVGNDATGIVGRYTTSGEVVNANLISGLDLDSLGGIVADGNGHLFVAANGTIGEYTYSGATINASLLASLNDPLWFPALTMARVAPSIVFPTNYSVIDLGTLGGANSYAHGINSLGEVVGWSDTSNNLSHAFLWSNGRINDLGTFGGQNSGAFAINDSGQIVGFAGTTNNAPHAFLFSNSIMADINPSGAPYSRANGINQAGDICGEYVAAGGVYPGSSTFAFFLGDETFIDLGTSPGSVGSTALGVNSARQIVGAARQSNSGNLAVTWTPDVLNPTNFIIKSLSLSASVASSINDTDQIVGHASPGAPFYDIVMWSDLQTNDLGTAIGFSDMRGFGINNFGQAVGIAGSGAIGVPGTLEHAITYDPTNGIRDLNALIPPDSNWLLTEAYAINSLGLIAGFGITNGQTHAFLLVPGWGPFLYRYPENQNVIGNSSATFNVLASGASPLSYQWLLNGLKLSDDLRIVGAQSNVLTIVGAQIGDVGNYQLVVSNAFGTVTSAVATLNVQLCEPPPAGLVAWWRAENNTLDTIGTNNGALLGGTSFGPGVVGNTFVLDGVNSAIEVPDAPALNPSNEVTVEAWYKPVSFIGNGNNSIVDKGYYSHSFPYYQYHLGVTGDQFGLTPASFLFWVAPGAAFAITDPFFWTPGRWYHLVGTYDGTSVNLYVDGVLINSKATSGPMSDYGRPLVIGGFSNLSEFTPGSIDEVSIYNRALSSNEIVGLYAAGSVGKCSDISITGNYLVMVNDRIVTEDLTVTNSANIAIVSGFASPVILYTLDGRYPGTGPFYSGSFQLTESAIVRAIAYTPDYSSFVESFRITITVVRSPTISQQPESQIRLKGQAAPFNVVASGTAPLTYQWFFKGNPIPNEQSSTLARPNVQSGDVGDYVVAIANQQGSVTSAPASLAVFELPAFLLQPSSTNVALNDPATFSVSVSGTPPLQFQWRHNGVNFPGATNATFNIPHVGVNDGGSYTVIVANDFGTIISDPAQLIVQTTPVQPGDNFIDAVPINGSSGIVSGTNTLATKEAGEPNHAGKAGGRSVWYKWQAPANGIVTVNTRGSTFDTLLGVYLGTSVDILTTIASDEDSGGSLTSEVRFNTAAGTEYKIAIDGVGETEGYFLLSWDLQNTVQSVPVILEQPVSVAVLLESNTSFSVTATGSSLNYQWFFNDQPIAGAISSLLSITNAEIPKIGNYTVRVGNSFGLAVTSAPASLELVSQSATPTQDKFADVDAFSTGNQLLAPAKGKDNLTPVSLGVAGYQFFQNLRSSTDPLDPANCAIGGASRWLKVVAGTDGLMSIDTVTSQVQTVIAVYRGGDLRDITTANLITCDINSAADGHSLVRFPVQAGVTNSVLVDGVDGATGLIYLHYNLGIPPTVAQTPITPIIAEGGTLSLVGPVSGGTPSPNYRWYRNNLLLIGENGPNLVINNVTANAAGVYALVASNSFGLSSNIVARVTIDVPLHINSHEVIVGGGRQFHIMGSASRAFVVQGTTNFLNWIPLYTNTVPFAPVDFSDPGIAGFPVRFYRAIPWP